MNKDDTIYLKDIFDAIHRIEDYTKEVNYSNFMNSNLIQAGVIRELEIIGEATKKLTQQLEINIRIYPEENGWNEGQIDTRLFRCRYRCCLGCG
ncbi:MAG: HepT-like ribonuclease domain-containing protein [bacterium]